MWVSIFFLHSVRLMSRDVCFFVDDWVPRCVIIIPYLYRQEANQTYCVIGAARCMRGSVGGRPFSGPLTAPHLTSPHSPHSPSLHFTSTSPHLTRPPIHTSSYLLSPIFYLLSSIFSHQPTTIEKQKRSILSHSSPQWPLIRAPSEEASPT